jgi:tRNA G18 (ribose-2'-O)-methylase SpoU
VSEKISIPAYGNAESLNAAVAAGIIISEFRRRGA